MDQTSLPGTFMTIPTPSQSCDVPDYSNSAVPLSNNGLANQEVHISKIQNAMAIMEDQNRTHDPRYQKMSELNDRMQGRTPVQPPSSQQQQQQPENVPPTPEQRKKLVEQLRAQVSAYRITRCGETIPSNILAQATASLNTFNSMIDGLPPPYQIPCELADGQQLPFDIMQ